MGKGQIAEETAVSLMLLFMLFILIQVVVADKGQMQDNYSTAWEEETECKELAAIMSEIYTAGTGAKWSGDIKAQRLYVFQTQIVLENVNIDSNESCNFHGKAAIGLVDCNSLVVENVSNEVVIGCA